MSCFLATLCVHRFLVVAVGGLRCSRISYYQEAVYLLFFTARSQLPSGSARTLPTQWLPFCCHVLVMVALPGWPSGLPRRNSVPGCVVWHLEACVTLLAAVMQPTCTAVARCFLPMYSDGQSKSAQQLVSTPKFWIIGCILSCWSTLHVYALHRQLTSQQKLQLASQQKLSCTCR